MEERQLFKVTEQTVDDIALSILTLEIIENRKLSNKIPLENQSKYNEYQFILYNFSRLFSVLKFDTNDKEDLKSTSRLKGLFTKLPSIWPTVTHILLPFFCLQNLQEKDNYDGKTAVAKISPDHTRLNISPIVLVSYLKTITTVVAKKFYRQCQVIGMADTDQEEKMFLAKLMVFVYLSVFEQLSIRPL